jgi:hypothetical protein
MCQAIASVVAEKISVIDLVIWRFATLSLHYEVWFSNMVSQCNIGVSTPFLLKFLLKSVS